jgi:formate dehydrogenase subunit delta
MSHDKLVYMANQIGRFFANQGEDKAVAAIADHIRKFWEPRMREQIVARHRADASVFAPFVAKAVASLEIDNQGSETRESPRP